jgi:hypothetical protein
MKPKNMETILNTIVGNDSTTVRTLDGYNYSNRLETISNKGEAYFCSPFLSYGDYDHSSAVERSNVRMFLKEFKDHPDVRVKQGGYGWEAIFIDVLCTDTEIIEMLQSLENYPCINDEDVSNLEMEMEQESWENWIKSDFLQAIVKHYKADWEDADTDKLYTLYNELKESTNTYFEVEAGGNGYIDIKRLISGLPEQAPSFLKLEYWD